MALPVSTIEEVITFASTEVAKNPNREFILKADKDAPYGTVDEVLDALKQSKVKFIFLLSEQLTADQK
jgi:biopolymer transport protein ExbD